jgi:hypothetical protein
MAALVPAQRRTQAPNYDPAKEITMQGSVEDVIVAQRGATTNIHLTVKAETETFDVRSRPARLLEQEHCRFAKGRPDQCHRRDTGHRRQGPAGRHRRQNEGGRHGAGVV